MIVVPRKIRAYPCADCGEWTVRPRLSYEPWICRDCGIRRMIKAHAPNADRTLGYDRGHKAGGAGHKE